MVVVLVAGSKVGGKDLISAFCVVAPLLSETYHNKLQSNPSLFLGLL